jgi:glycine C-acetyltransferase
MYTKNLLNDINQELKNLQTQGKYKTERLLTSAQGPVVKIGDREVLMFASNNYLGLSNHPEIVAAGRHGLEQYGFGLSSVRFICGTQELHRELEQKVAKFLGTEEAILYSTCFMANLGFFASIINESVGPETHQDIIYSDELNHASIIDAFKLVKRDRLQKRIYPHSDMAALEKMLADDKNSQVRHKIIARRGFSQVARIGRLG